MPRLLLVDDNPSIHKIAETLLATTPIELVCVDSAAAALDKVNQGEHFDVALVDTSMAGMDGWGLLEKLRQMPTTARMPIAMMAGVLDTVDPARIESAPIQGFLKKPVELRELSDRITKLMETPVPEPVVPVPVAPVQAAPVQAAPEPPLPPAPKMTSPFATLPAVRIDELPEYRRKDEAPEALDDLLELTEEDLYPEDEPAPVVAEESLDLEELDLDGLRNLQEAPVETEVTPAPFPPLEEHTRPTPQSVPEPLEDLDAIATLDKLPEAMPPAVTPQEELPVVAPEMELPDLGPTQDELLEVSPLSGLPEIEELVTSEQVSDTEIPLATLLEAPREEAVFTPPLPPLEESLDWSDESESMLAAVEAPAPALPEITEPAPEELDLLEVTELDASLEPQTLQLEPTEVPAALPLPEAVPLSLEAIPLSTEAIVESALLETATEEPVVETVTEAMAAPAALPLQAGTSKELLDAMMADPAMMDALAKAVVARLGDQVLREIAWEVIPEVAERLPRN